VEMKKNVRCENRGGGGRRGIRGSGGGGKKGKGAIAFLAYRGEKKRGGGKGQKEGWGGRGKKKGKPGRAEQSFKTVATKYKERGEVRDKGGGGGGGRGKEIFCVLVGKAVGGKKGERTRGRKGGDANFSFY